MNIQTKKIHNFAYSPLLTLLCSFATLASFGYLLYDTTKLLPLIIFIVTLILFVCINCYSLWIRRAYNDFHRIPEHLHSINHLYRDSLSRLCSNHQNSPDENTVLQEQTSTLTSVCDLISKIYFLLIEKETQVTIKLLSNLQKNELTCSTYTRNGGKNIRDQDAPQQFRVLTGENTGFDEALRRNPGRLPSHYQSPDLTKEKSYKNQRGQYKEYYKSTIIVPIRYAIPEKSTGRDGTDDIGFLCIDTLSRNRLNNDSHVHLLAAFADQMYNYMSIIRGNYKFPKANTTQ